MADGSSPSRSTRTRTPGGNVCGRVSMSVLAFAVFRPAAVAGVPEDLAHLPVPPATAEASFRGWAEEVALTEGGRLGALWTVELDGDATLERAARICGDARAATVLVEDPDTGQRWRVRHDAARTPMCSGNEGVVWQHADEGLVLARGAGGEDARHWLGLRDGQLVEAARRIARDRDESLSSELEVRWDLRSIVGRTAEGGAASRRIEREGTVVSVQARAATLQPALTFVRSGRLRWHGEDDASMALGAVLTREGRVRLDVAVTDDDRVTAADASTMDAADHVEIWWAPPHTDVDDPFGDEHTARGLKITPLAGDRLQVAWIGTATGEKPEVWGNAQRLQVTFPATVGPRDDSAWSMPLVVALHDVDRERDGAPTVVATSRFVPGWPGTFGWVAWHPEGRRFPQPASVSKPRVPRRSCCRRLPPRGNERHRMRG